MTSEERIAFLEAQLAAEKRKNTKTISFECSQKGCVSIKGIRRFPISLYPKEIETILENSDNLQAFIEQNKSRLSMKGMEE